ncbi:MAG: hypothetical protein JRE58_03660, partial [Deltaproteobacteria bacterium]|nr:hypothetical protein [Deltaproteobacteria bacterium]
HILWYAKNSYSRDVTGTYINRNHLAGLLSMGLLTAAAYAAALARPKRERPKGLPGGMIAGACGLLCMGLIFIFRRAQRRKGVALLGLFLVTAGYAVYIGAEYPMGRFN